MANTETNHKQGLQPGTQYLISVQAIRGTTEGKAASVTGVTDASGIDGIRVTGQTEDSLEVVWQNPGGPGAAAVDHFRLTHTDPRGHEGQHDVQQSQEARTKHTIVGRVRVPNKDNSYLIAGLIPGVTYAVEVYAVISGFQSEPDSIEATTDGGLSGGGLAESRGPGAAAVDHFRLTHTDPRGHEGQHDVQQSQEARTKHTIVGLQPGTQYLISIFTDFFNHSKT
ncbi:hypothetical protein CRUP_017337 [Coryphaenoides rupestris]|nr:hypothetical protein CRUP_017337 [Coryphaenoides rupestris]